MQRKMKKLIKNHNKYQDLKKKKNKIKFNKINNKIQKINN